ncbi:selenocysteine-specific translation elongation factor [soil metagenome]
MIVATAGHVDHGKTSLVKALTEVDTDRLEEEKRRGMSIDIGFAYADVGAATSLGFVDVPGHERFVRNMLAGVACIDLALLVIAADDGPMPQTREHLAILGLLGVPRCAVVLTKIDRVTPERLAQVEREVAELLRPGPFHAAPVFPLVATSGVGVPALRQHLADAAVAFAARPVAGHFRLAVDRSFALAGAGRIVTGAVLSGSVKVGDQITVSPRGTAARVRGIHAQNQRAEVAVAGQRCALNLAGVDLKDADPVRGDWVVAPEAHAPNDRIDVHLDVLASEARPLAHRAALQLHIGAAAVNARVATLGGPSVAPGDSAMAQLMLERPIATLHGDRFILRDSAAGRTVAGGRVIDPFGPARGRSKPARALHLAAMALREPADALAAVLEAEPEGIDWQRFALARNLTAGEAALLLEPPSPSPQPPPHSPIEAPLPAPWPAPSGTSPGIVVIATGPTPIAMSSTHWQALRERVRTTLARWHADRPDSVGASEAALSEQLGMRRTAPLVRAALASLVDDATAAREGLRYRLADHRAVLSPADSALLARVTAVLQPAGLRPPIVGELAALLDIPQPGLLDFLMRASQLGALVRVAPNRFYLPHTVAELVAQAHALAAESADGRFDAAAYRDRTGIGRNLTVQVLEFLDREGATHFDGARRSAKPAC